ncbi:MULTISPECIES: AI-2E family transporter [Methylobacterium]|uniref:AI-2E family transporter n=7 Tax=Pseudomonadota TaxID=1224 RepID=A0ABQ4SQD1_9HYPH|nr:MULTISPECIES: AI-2E family transporter [Methylobacterium]PIU05091.1 MAG: AI-2E family transporter [Methylobacterium sp. CG09_land_8_20_14_0_10_71_15]PIU11307.1 MAG: AI-2E family transporter [Methylobacterium sp. CG08_land_8_20_14_0_20_71_15]GBU18518.1 ABC transporter permease [Methylobacterium sp.]GJE04714.1 hypothetical protein AOPFMNJM_0004 [Methylobacterium jeotgali]
MAASSRTVDPYPTPQPTRVPAAETPGAGLAISILAVAVIIAGLYFARDILIPIAIAVLLAFVIAPLVNLLRRIRLPRVAAILSAVMLTVGILVAIGTLIGVQVADLAGDVPRYRSTIERKVEGLKNSPAGKLTDYVAGIGRVFHNTTEKQEEKKTPESDAAPTQPPEEKALLVQVKDRQPGPMELATTLLSPIVHPLATAGIMFVVLMFILMQREDLRDRLIRLAGSNDLHRTTVAMDDAARRLSRYFVVQVGLNAAFGLVIGVGLYFIGVPNPVLWGIFSALMRFVPYIGAFLSALLPLALAAAVDPGWNMVIATAILFLIIEPLTGHVIEPMLYGHSTGLSPFAVLVSALFWTWLWGPIGLLLSTPLTVCLVVLGRHVERLQFLDVLFGDKPALTPVENFYQRILADDPEEAQEQADVMLRTCSLTGYYDEVVVKGLELAARDAARGVLSNDQKGAIRASLTELIEELEDHPDKSAKAEGGEEAAPPPAPWQAEGAVLCVAGRGFVDQCAASILAQILRKRGIGARVVPFADTARVRIPDFDPGPARMICVISLAIAGEPAHLRRLVRRIEARMPTLPIVMGLWRAEDVRPDDLLRRQTTGADRHVGSLGEALEAVLHVVRRGELPEPAEPEPTPSAIRPLAAAGA